MNVASHTPPVPYTRSTTAYAGAVTRAVAFAADVAIVYALLFVIGVVVGLIISAFGTFSTLTIAGSTLTESADQTNVSL